MREADDAARALPDPDFVRRPAERAAGRFPEPLAPPVGRGGTNAPPTDLEPMPRDGSPAPAGTPSPWRSSWYELTKGKPSWLQFRSSPAKLARAKERAPYAGTWGSGRIRRRRRATTGRSYWEPPEKTTGTSSPDTRTRGHPWLMRPTEERGRWRRRRGCEQGSGGGGGEE